MFLPITILYEMICESFLIPKLIRIRPMYWENLETVWYSGIDFVYDNLAHVRYHIILRMKTYCIT